MIDRLEGLHPDRALVRSAADEVRGADPVELRVADDGPEVVLLVHRVEKGLARARMVEREVEVVRPEPTLGPEGVDDRELDAFMLLEERHHVHGRGLPEVDLAVHQGVHGGGGVGDVDPLHPVHLDHLAARRRARGLGAGHVVLVLDVDDLRSGHPLVLHELEGSGADDLRHLHRRLESGMLLLHHEGRVGADLAERGEHEAVGLVQGEGERLVVDDRELLGELDELLAHSVLRAPALDGSDAVRGGHRVPVVPHETVAQGEGVGEAIVAHRPVTDHLRLDLEVLVRREQGVVHHVPVVAGDVGGGPDRVDVLEVRVRDDPQDLLRKSRPGGEGQTGRDTEGDGGRSKSANVHEGGLPSRSEGRARVAQRTGADGAAHGRFPAPRMNEVRVVFPVPKFSP